MAAAAPKAVQKLLHSAPLIKSLLTPQLRRGSPLAHLPPERRSGSHGCVPSLTRISLLLQSNSRSISEVYKASNQPTVIGKMVASRSFSNAPFSHNVLADGARCATSVLRTHFTPIFCARLWNNGTNNLHLASRGFANLTLPITLKRCSISHLASAQKSYLGKRAILGHLAIRSGSILKQVRTYTKPFTDREGVVHFRRRGFDSWTPQGGGNQLNDQQRKVLAIVVFLIGGATLIYVTHLETVPYTRRRHCILWSPEFEKKMGDNEFEELKLRFRGTILPPFHPEAQRVRRIAADIIRAALKEVKSEHDHDSHHELHGVGAPSANPNRVIVVPIEVIPSSKTPKQYGWFGDEDEEQQKGVEAHKDPWGGHQSKELGEKYGEAAHGGRDYAKKLEDDDKWIDRTRKHGLRSGSEGFVDHLKNLNWEVIVVDKPLVNAFCLPGGKVVVFTGLLKKMPNDVELATVLGHEIGHLVARHAMERLTTGLLVVAFQLVALQFVNMPYLLNTVTDLVFNKPFSRMHEIEADRIGLLLEAAAGYDPSAAPAVYEKLSEAEEVSQWAQYISTHPSGKRRAELLRKASTMQEALAIYREKVAGKALEGFL